MGGEGDGDASVLLGRFVRSFLLATAMVVGSSPPSSGLRLRLRSAGVAIVGWVGWLGGGLGWGVEESFFLGAVVQDRVTVSAAANCIGAVECDNCSVYISINYSVYININCSMYINIDRNIYIHINCSIYININYSISINYIRPMLINSGSSLL